MTDDRQTRPEAERATTFRLAQSDDLDLLLEFMRGLQEDDPWSIAFNPAHARRAMQQLLADQTLGRVWIIHDAAQAIGYIVMSFDFSLEYGGRNAWIDAFFIQRSDRGKGIGTRALEFFATQAQALGVTAIHLEVNRGNPALELYRRMGYQDHQRYLMTKWLPPKD
jgi:GNAT superfamily N-acetyltransferase